jgi:hypothetical protein
MASLRRLPLLDRCEYEAMKRAKEEGMLIQGEGDLRPILMGVTPIFDFKPEEREVVDCFSEEFLQLAHEAVKYPELAGDAVHKSMYETALGTLPVYMILKRHIDKFYSAVTRFEDASTDEEKDDFVRVFEVAGKKVYLFREPPIYDEGPSYYLGGTPEFSSDHFISAN